MDESRGRDPVLEKLTDAFGHACKVYTVGAALAPLPPHSRFVQEFKAVLGPEGFLQCATLVTWCPQSHTLTLSFRGSHALFDQVMHDDEALTRLVPPFYLRELDSGARVVAPFAAAWERMHSGVLRAMRELMGAAEPRRVLCCGYCSGGGLASLAAPWAALTYPSADVRCVTFGAPRVGNSDFQRAHSFLVGLSYRAVYRFDPFIDKPKPRLGLSLQLQAVGSELFFDGRTAQQLRVPLRFKHALEDHFFSGYIDGVVAAGGAAPELPTNPMGQASLVDPAALSSAPELDERGDCTGRCPHAEPGAAAGAPAAAAAQRGAPGVGALGVQGGDGAAAVGESPGEQQGSGPLGWEGEVSGGSGSSKGLGKSWEGGSGSASGGGSRSASPPESPQSSLQPPGTPPPQLRSRAADAIAAAGEADAAIAAAEGADAERAAAAMAASDEPVRGGWGLSWLWCGGPAARSMRRVISGGSKGEDEGGQRPQGNRPRRRSLARSQPSTELALQDFWGEIKMQTSRVQSMYHHFVASGGAKQFPESAWILEATYACATGGVPQTPTGAGGEGAAGQLLAPEAAQEAAAPAPGAAAAAGPQQCAPPGAGGGIGTASTAPGTAAPDTAAGLEPEGSLSPRHDPGAADLWAEAAELVRSEAALAEVVRPSAGPTQAGWAAGEEAVRCSSGEGIGGIGEAAAGAAAAGAPGFAGGQAGGRSGGRHFDLGEAQLPAGWQAAGSLEEAMKAVAAAKLQRAALCAHASYYHLTEFEALTGLRGAVLVEDPATDAQAYVAWQPPATAVFVFRGTANRLDAAVDLKFMRRQVEFLPRSFPGCKAHIGFLCQFVGITSASDPARNLGAVLGTLSGGATPGRVICIGHSLGGALATLGATWAALQYPHADVRCLTFGSPRVGNRKFVRAFQTLVGTRLRVVHGADPITAVPPAFRYRHVEPGVYLNRGGIMLLSRELWPRRFMFNLTDHFIRGYVDSLQTVLHRAEAAAMAHGSKAGKGTTGSPLGQRNEGEAAEEEGKPAMEQCWEAGKEQRAQQEAGEEEGELQQAEGLLGEGPLVRLRCRRAG